MKGVGIMKDKRRYTRFKVDLMEINGRMSLADNVKIIDISFGGVAIKADRRLNMGKEILLKLGEQEKSIDVRGIVVRSELTGIEEKAHGEKVLVYTAGIMFKDGQATTIADFLKSVEQRKNFTTPVMVDRRLSIRFLITTSQQNILSFPAQFKVMEISISGMRIKSEQPLNIEDVIPMELSLSSDNPVTFTGRVASCTLIEDEGQARYEMGIEFKNLTDQDTMLLKQFIDYLATINIDLKGDGKNTGR
jgi:hypothetical protein